MSATDDTLQSGSLQSPPGTPTAELSAAGVSIWLDDLSRERITSGDLAELITTRNVVGVTTNPTIFAHALRDGESYAPQVATLVGEPIDEVVRQLCATDVRDACDLFAPIFEATDGRDGRVSIEVEPALAMDPDATVAQAVVLRDLVSRPGVLIKIPATIPGLEAIRRTVAAGISVNVTLIFSVERYRQVIEAYLGGLEDALAAGLDISAIRSVASVFVSRIDTEVDRRLDEIGTESALALQGQLAIANSRLAYQLFNEGFSTPRFTALAEHGAHVQRPLWASTGVKNPHYPDTRYVTELVAPDTVNTMPEATLDAVADHGQITGDTIAGQFATAAQTVSAVTSAGVDLEDVFGTLESEGLAKFEESWLELVATVEQALNAA